MGDREIGRETRNERKQFIENARECSACVFCVLNDMLDMISVKKHIKILFTFVLI